MAQPWLPQHPLGSHPPSQEDLEAVDKALEILAVDDRTYYEPLFSFVQARIQGLQEVLDVLTRSGRWVPALSDEELHDLVTGLASKKAPAEVLEEIRRRYVYPRCIKKGQRKAAEASKLGHWEKRGAEMTEFLVGSGHGQSRQPPPAPQYFLAAQQYASPAQHQSYVAQQFHLPAQQLRLLPVQQYQPTTTFGMRPYDAEKGQNSVKEKEGLTDLTDDQTDSSSSPFPAYDERTPTHPQQCLATQRRGMRHHDRQYQPSPTSGTKTHVAEGRDNAVRKEEPLPNMSDNGAGSPYRAIYEYARGIPNPGAHDPAPGRAGGGDHHRQAVVPPPPTPTWSESTTGPQTHQMRKYSDSLHIDPPSPLPSFFTSPVATASNVQPNIEKGRTGSSMQSSVPLKLTTRGDNVLLKDSVQRTSAPRTSDPGTSAPRTSAPRTTAPRTTTTRTSGPKVNAPKTSAPKTTGTNKQVQRNRGQQKGGQKKAIWR